MNYNYFQCCYCDWKAAAPELFLKINFIMLLHTPYSIVHFVRLNKHEKFLRIFE
jgi:hypothetical protein